MQKAGMVEKNPRRRFLVGPHGLRFHSEYIRLNTGRRYSADGHADIVGPRLSIGGHRSAPRELISFPPTNRNTVTYFVRSITHTTCFALRKPYCTRVRRLTVRRRQPSWTRNTPRHPLIPKTIGSRLSTILLKGVIMVRRAHLGFLFVYGISLSY